MAHSRSINDLLSVLTEELSLQELLAADIKSNVACAIASHRIHNQMNQAELAKSINKAQSTIAKWENGDQNFTIDTLSEISVLLGMDLTIKLEETPTQNNIAPHSYRNKVVDVNFSRNRSSYYDDPKSYYVERKEM